TAVHEDVSGHARDPPPEERVVISSLFQVEDYSTWTDGSNTCCRARTRAPRRKRSRRSAPRRTPMPVFHYVVLTQAVPGRLEGFEEGDDKQHLRDVVRVPGARCAS